MNIDQTYKSKSRFGIWLLVSTILFSVFSITPTQANSTVIGCSNAKGDVRLVVKGKKCLKGEKKVKFNLAGQQGPAGPVGPAGPAGPAGKTGDVGPVGPAGAAGVGARGATGPAGPVGATGDTGRDGTSSIWFSVAELATASADVNAQKANILTGVQFASGQFVEVLDMAVYTSDTHYQTYTSRPVPLNWHNATSITWRIFWTTQVGVTAEEKSDTKPVNFVLSTYGYQAGDDFVTPNCLASGSCAIRQDRLDYTGKTKEMVQISSVTINNAPVGANNYASMFENGLITIGLQRNNEFLNNGVWDSNIYTGKVYVLGVSATPNFP